jgi:hypothetical protein
MILLPRRSQPEDEQTPQLLHYTLYRKIAKLLLVVLLCAVGALCYPYCNLLLYPYAVFATIPAPNHTTEIVSDSSLSTTCHTSSILRIYRTDRSFEEIKNFYTDYIRIRENIVWTLIDEGDSSASTRPDYWISRRRLTGWNASNQSLTFSLRRFETGMFDGYVADRAQQALRDGKTVYFLVIAYTDDFKQNRVAVGDRKSGCFID